MQNKVDVAVMIGSGVPETLRALGQKACWVVLLNGEQRGTAFASREEAQAINIARGLCAVASFLKKASCSGNIRLHFAQGYTDD